MTSIPTPRSARVDGEHPPLLAVAPLLRTSAGSPAELTVTITNQAPASRVVHLQALGLDPSWLPAPSSTPLLAPGQTHTVSLALTPPTGTLPAHYPFVVTAQSADTTGAATAKPAVAETAILVNPRAQLRLELLPPSVSAWRSRKMNLRLTNSGAGMASVRLQPQSTGSVRLRLSDKAVEIPAGATITVPGRVRVLHPQLVGFRMRHIVRVEATGSETAKYAEGEVVQRPLLPQFWLKFVAIAAALAVWVSAGLVLLPRLTHLIGSDSSTSIAGGPSTGGSAADGGDGTNGGGSSTSQGGTKSKIVTAASIPGVQLNGTIKADAPGGVTVLLRRTSLVDEAALGATPVGSVKAATAAASTSLGKMMPVASTTAPPVGKAAKKRTSTSSSSATRSIVTGQDGVWSFPGVAAPGFYLLTFAKTGFEPRSFVVDSATESAAQPLAVDLAPGDGTITGAITGAGKALGGATVTVTDGVSALTTQTLSKGNVGSFTVKDLATPGTYVVSASRDGLSLESKVVTLTAGGSARVGLNLRTGVAALTGKITAGADPVGGATVTVSDETGRSYTSTSETSSVATTPALRGSTAGSYHVPGLPAPGRYTVTVAAAGFQTLTTTLKLAAGQSSRTRDLELVSSTGSVVGQVTDNATPAVGLPDAGLVLTNSERSYKQTSTTAVANGVSTAGFVEFDGVAPGTYQLTTELWGYTSATTTVVVAAGQRTAIAPKLIYQPVSEIAANGRISGSVIDAGTRMALNCTNECLTAVTTDPCPHEKPNCAADHTDADTYSVNFAPSTDFTLPAGAAGTPGLRPGLHTVTVSAPGYEPTSARIAVPASGTVTMPVIGLYPAPTISGTVSIGDGSNPSGNICVYAVSTATAPTTCAATPGVSPGCTVSPASYQANSPDLTRICALTDSSGDYSIQVPSHGGWTIYAIPANGYYESSAPAALAVEQGGSKVQNLTLNRWGRATVNLKVAGDDTLSTSAAVGSVLTATNTTTHIETTFEADADGAVTIPGLASGPYTFAATDAEDHDLAGSVSLTLAYNTNRTLSLMLTKPLPFLLGQVTTTLQTGEVRSVAQAQASVTGVYRYDQNDAPVNRLTTFTTSADGCFAGLSGAGSMTPAQIDAALPLVEPCDEDLKWSDRGTSAPREIDFVSPIAAGVKVTAPGYNDRSYTNLTWGSVPNALTLEAKRVTWSGLRLTLPGTSTPAGLTFAVAGVPGGGAANTPMPGITLLSDGTSGTSLSLIWKDGSQSPNSFGPGTYALTASAPGYATTTSTMTCQVNGTCALDESWSLPKLGSIAVRFDATTSSGGSPIPNADVTVQPCGDAACATTTGDPYLAKTAGNGKVTVTGTSAREGLITPGYSLGAGGPQWFKVSVTAPKFTAPDAQIVTLNSPGDDGSVTFAADHVLTDVKVQVIGQDRKPISFAQVELVGPTTIALIADSAHPGDYLATSVPPATYSVRIVASALKLTTDYGLTIEPGTESYDYVAYVARGASRVFGTVASNYTAPGSATKVPIGGASVVLTCDPDTAYDASLCPADGPAIGTDGEDLTTTSALNGYYDFDNVPNGTYVVTASASGWQGTDSPAIAVEWTRAAPLSQDFSLAPVAQTATITLDPASSGQTLSDFKATVTPSDTTYGQKTLTDIALSSTGTASVPNLPFGCYTVTFTKPTDHYGTPEFSAQTAGDDDNPACAQLDISRLPSTPDDDRSAAVTYVLDEAPLTTTIEVGQHWHEAPTNATLTLIKAGTTVVDEQAVSASVSGVATTIWVPSGSWTVKAAAASSGAGYSYPAAFWPVQSTTVSVGTGAASAALSLEENDVEVTVKVPNGDTSMSIKVTPTDGFPLTLPLTPVVASLSSHGRATIDLPGGTYDVEVVTTVAYQNPPAYEIDVASPAADAFTLPALERTTNTVQIELAAGATTGPADLSGWKVKLTNIANAGDTTALTSLDSDGKVDLTVAWGCWKATFVAPTGDDRTWSFTTQSGATGCGAAGINLAAGSTPTTATYALTDPPSPPSPPGPPHP